MKKAFLLVLILFVSVISTACINNFAVQELNNKAKTSLDSGDYESAINRLKASIDLDGTIFETHYNLGIAYTQAEKYPEAVDTFQNALKLKPDFTDAYYSLAVAQENFAQSIINGELTADGKKIENKDKPDDSEDVPAQKKLNKDEKAKVVQLLNDAMTSYGTYLEKGNEIKDKQDVEQKIESIKTQIQKIESASAE